MHDPDAHVTLGGVGVVVSDYRQARPAPALRGSVAAYSGYRDAGGPAATHVGLPSPFLTFIVTLDDDLEMLAGDGRATFANLVAGIDTRPVTIVHDGRQSGVQISLHPAGARALFGCTTAALGPESHRASDVAPSWVDELQDRVRSATTWDARFAAADAVLTRVLRPSPVDPALTHAWHALREGGWSVAGLADRMGWDARRLRREFDAEFGISPKTVARLGRFDRARRDLLGTGERPSLAHLAIRHGYYDQAHLAREFRELAGLAPTALLTAERRS
ncbi:helix-turn-helix domain-containing protein [Jatrophihabitans sp. YIM 134969]